LKILGVEKSIWHIPLVKASDTVLLSGATGAVQRLVIKRLGNT